LFCIAQGNLKGTLRASLTDEPHVLDVSRGIYLRVEKEIAKLKETYEPLAQPDRGMFYLDKS
jgi:hypothetical protein